MATPFLITLPAGDDALRREIEDALAPHADVEARTPQTFGLNEISLIVSMVTGSIGTITSVVALLLQIRDRRKSAGRSLNIYILPTGGGPKLSLADADEATLRRALEGGNTTEQR